MAVPCRTLRKCCAAIVWVCRSISVIEMGGSRRHSPRHWKGVQFFSSLSALGERPARRMDKKKLPRSIGTCLGRCLLYRTNTVQALFATWPSVSLHTGRTPWWSLRLAYQRWRTDNPTISFVSKDKMACEFLLSRMGDVLHFAVASASICQREQCCPLDPDALLLSGGCRLP